MISMIKEIMLKNTYLILNNSELNNESLIILAAHSGNGKLAYFNRLNELKENDKVRLSINNKELVYKVKKIEEQDKNW